jgi:hypothetical protein
MQKEYWRSEDRQFVAFYMKLKNSFIFGIHE